MGHQGQDTVARQRGHARLKARAGGVAIGTSGVVPGGSCACFGIAGVCYHKASLSSVGHLAVVPTRLSVWARIVTQDRLPGRFFLSYSYTSSSPH